MCIYICTNTEKLSGKNSISLRTSVYPFVLYKTKEAAAMDDTKRKLKKRNGCDAGREPASYVYIRWDFEKNSIKKYSFRLVALSNWINPSCAGGGRPDKTGVSFPHVYFVYAFIAHILAYAICVAYVCYVLYTEMRWTTRALSSSSNKLRLVWWYFCFFKQ